ncbi:peptidase [Pseudoprevotella muciniphila]|uniref:Peptidase n=1 Tax=Pseudoprevotella muciniphila TaxID=2133944 RepID=A0A5P8E7S5_9BACT|nr:HK97 family phage prohead protease [Pseudoprevotella muciniphila]QFQ13075.1 peptidase [Pseudoprevotella muciniphila]
MSKTKRVRISNERLNSYGTRVLTTGMDVEQYNRNPVLLYMHERGQVIGYVKDLKVEGDEVTGELMFDEATELSQRCKKQWEFGSLKMVSVGIDILELSEDPKHLVQGQTSPTISKSKLFEVSLVDIGANDDAIVLQKDGQRIELGKDAARVLPLLHINNNKNQKPNQMDQEKLALELGLPKDADESAINEKLAKLKAEGAEAETLRQERDTLRAARIETLVNSAIAEKKIGEDKKQQFLDLGKKIGADELKQTFDAMSPQVKLSNIVTGGGAPAGGHAEYKKLSDVPSDELAKLREDNPAQYKKLYKAEYGIECEI